MYSNYNTPHCGDRVKQHFDNRNTQITLEVYSFQIFTRAR